MTIEDYSSLFATIRHYSHCSYYSLFATIRCSLFAIRDYSLFAIRVFQTPDIDKFITQANSHHPTIKFAAEISNTEATFLDTVVYKSKRFQYQSLMDINTHFKPTETFQYTHFSSSHQQGVKKGFMKGKALKTSTHEFFKKNS